MQKAYREERRRYIRLSSVFPVEIYLKDPQKDKTRLIQAFTRDVSLGGLCLSVNNPDDSFLSLLRKGDAFLEIAINIPISLRPVEALVKVIWYDVKEDPIYMKIFIGTAFERIDDAGRSRIVATARRIKWLPKITVFSVAVLVSLLFMSRYEGTMLRERNRELIERFHRMRELNEIYKTNLSHIDNNYEMARTELERNQMLIVELQRELDGLKKGDEEAVTLDKARLEENLSAALSEKARLEERFRVITDEKEKTSRLLKEVRYKRRQLEEATVTNMYRWLRIHQNKLTGLVMSFEGDSAVKDWAFTYDQALAAQAFLISGDTERSRQILAFYRNIAKRKNGLFLNAYNTLTGAITEDVVHVGPNTWIAIAAIHYSKKTGDKAYLKLAEDVAGRIIEMKDADGGIKGGPAVEWYSTEHNLDAYALFNMLFAVTSDNAYRRERDSTLKWIRAHTYSKETGGMKRGKGDSTIATDTLAWAIAAIGPAALMKHGMDPDGIMKFAEDFCRVTTKFTRPDGAAVSITGFDFARTRNVARLGIVSSEWTAQMVIAFRLMANYHSLLNEHERAEEFKNKADFYSNELDKLVISSPSPSGQGAGCLPYSSQPNADTGHGWRTPDGEDTGSVAGTAYTIFAKKGYNPMWIE